MPTNGNRKVRIKVIANVRVTTDFGFRVFKFLNCTQYTQSKMFLKMVPKFESIVYFSKHVININEKRCLTLRRERK